MTSQALKDAAPIDARALGKTYRIGFLMNRQVHALQGVDLKVEAGQVFGLLGPNGAGKSTTIKILMNLVTPSAGTATLFGLPVTSTAARRMVGFLPENPAPYEYLTGREFVTLSGHLSGLSGHELDKRVTEVLGAVELGKAERLQIRRYSKGMVQRAALAHALVGRPKLLILDEPTSGLDPIGRSQMRDLILAERDRGTTILFCSHIIPDVEALCDRMVILVGGKVVREGSVKGLVAHSGNAVSVEASGLGADALTALGLGAPELRGERLALEIAEQETQRVLEGIWRAGGRVHRVVPAHVSLEQLFMDAVKQSGRASSVGGEIEG